MSVSVECADARALATAYRDRDGGDPSLLELALEGCIEIDPGVLGDAAVEAAALHIADCGPCQAWLDLFFPERPIRRIRSAKYCCASMQLAVTDPEMPLCFSFDLFRGEDPGWLVNETLAWVHFCPWCGQRLPDQPFEA